MLGKRSFDSDTPLFSEYFTAPEKSSLLLQRQRERRYQPPKDFMSRQDQLSPHMRAILINWMFEVSHEFRMTRETSYTAVNILDRYLGEKIVSRKSLQSVGTACLMIASKLIEIMYPKITDFVITCDGATNVEELKGLEVRIYRALKWKLLPVVTFSWVETYFRCLKDEESCTEETFSKVMTILDAAILVDETSHFLPSVLALSAIRIVQPGPMIDNHAQDDIDACTTHLRTLPTIDPIPLEVYSKRHAKFKIRECSMYSMQTFRKDVIDLVMVRWDTPNETRS